MVQKKLEISNLAKFEITNKGAFFHLKFVSQVDLETIRTAYPALLTQKDFTPESHTLWNFEDAIILLSIADMHVIAEAVIAAADKRAESAKSAFFVPDPHDAALLENYITLVAQYPVEFRIFDDWQQSIDWLSE